MKKITVTPIFILLVLFILLAGSVAFYNLVVRNEGGNSLGGGIAAVFSIFAFVMLVLEQAIVYYVNSTKKAVWIVEGLLIVVLIVVLRVTNFEFSIG